MKVGIITVFYTENYGSVLQAYALSEVIKDMGHEVVFISTKNKYSKHSIKNTVLSAGKQFLQCNIEATIMCIKKYFAFSKTLKNFKYIDYDDCIKEGIDIIVEGSDTVWDLNSKYFLESKAIFWPQDLYGIPMISYAASVANTTKEQFCKEKFPFVTWNKMKRISVRDDYSKDVIVELTNKDVEKTCDPTFLCERQKYDKFKQEIKHKNYILVYIFEDLEEKQISQIKMYAKENKKKLICVSQKIKWCDECVLPSLENFISYFSQADFVITNTFHGTVFSIIFERNFLCFGYYKKKIVSLLKQLNLENRMINLNSTIEFDKRINYQEVYIKIENMRKKSKEFLFDEIR